MSKKISLCVFLIILICFSTFASGNKEQANSESEIRIVSLAPNVTEIICALGAESNLVGRTAYCNYPETVSDIPSIGDLYDPNIELIVSLNPDVVISSSIVSTDVIDKLSEVGIETYQFFHEYEGLEGALTLIEEIGNTIKKEAEANALIQSLRSRKEKVENLCKGKSSKSCVAIITWGEWGDYAATGDTFIEDIIISAGGKNIASSAKSWSISKELLLDEDPDIIFLSDTSNYVDGDMIEAFKATEPYNLLKASKKNCIYLLNNDALSRQGIRSFDILEQVAEIINENR